MPRMPTKGEENWKYPVEAWPGPGVGRQEARLYFWLAHDLVTASARPFLKQAGLNFGVLPALSTLLLHCRPSQCGEEQPDQ